jgi:hypothetical protein
VKRVTKKNTITTLLAEVMYLAKECCASSDQDSKQGRKDEDQTTSIDEDYLGIQLLAIQFVRCAAILQYSSHRLPVLV